MANILTLCGEVRDSPALSHARHGKNFMEFTLYVPRLSGTVDILPVIAIDSVCEGVTAGENIKIDGELRSFNDREAEHNKLKIYSWAKVIESHYAENVNSIHLTGRLCKPAVYRRTPFGREIADIMLCAPRDGNTGAVHRVDYIPCIAWGSVARMCADLPPRSAIALDGRLQSRTYIKVIDGVDYTRTAYEVSVASVEAVEI